MPKEYMVTMKVWLNNPEEDDGAVGGSRIVDIKDDSGKSIDMSDDVVHNILHVIYPHSFKRRS